jgi:hypothetical protein
MNSFKIGGKCRVTGKYYEVFVDKKDYIAWQDGKNVQDAFPYLTASDREFLITGTSPEGWDLLFGDNNERKD